MLDGQVALVTGGSRGIGESASVPRLTCLALILLGVAGLKLLES